MKDDELYQRFAELWNARESIEKIIRILDINITIFGQLFRKFNEGKTNNYDNLIYLYNAGITDKEEIAEILCLSKPTIKNYLCQARREGKVGKPLSNEEKVIKLWNEGITDKEEIAQSLYLSKDRVIQILHKARKNGKIEKPPIKYEEVIRLWNEGITNVKEIAKSLDLSENTVKNYRFRARKEGRIVGKPRTKETTVKTAMAGGSQDKNRDIASVGEARIEELSRTIGISVDTMASIITLLKKDYPRNVAIRLRIPPHIVYAIIDKLNEDEKRTIDDEFLQNRSPNIYQRIKSSRKIGKTGIHVLQEVEDNTEKVWDLLELADVYYVLGMKSKSCGVLLRAISSKNSPSESMLSMILTRKQNIESEFNAKGIRKTYKESTVRRPSYKELASKFRVDEGFVMQVLGKERGAQEL